MKKRYTIKKRRVKRAAASTSPLMAAYTKVTGALPPVRSSTTPVSAPVTSPTPIVRSEPTPAQNLTKFGGTVMGAMKGAGGWVREQAKGGLQPFAATARTGGSPVYLSGPGTSDENVSATIPVPKAATNIRPEVLATGRDVSRYGDYAGLITTKAGGLDTRAADAAMSRAKAGVPKVSMPALESWGKKEDTGWVTGVNPSLDLAHLAPSERALTVAPTGRIYGGKSSSVDYLATSMDPAAVAWRARRMAEGPIDATKEAGPVGTVPGYRFIKDFSSQESSVKSIMKMPSLQAEAISAEKEPVPPGFGGEGVDIFGGPTQTYDIFGGALVKSKNIAGVTRSQRTGKRKKQLAKRVFPVVSVPGFKLDVKGIGVKKKKK